MLTRTEDIPLEYDYENAIEDVGESRWFWTEIPLDKINFRGDNYLILWSPNEYFTSTSSAPILAAAWGDKEVDSWLNTKIAGQPSDLEDPLSTPITVFEPAIAMKLIPKGIENNLKIEIIDIKDVLKDSPAKSITALIEGSGVERAWLEFSKNGRSWKKIYRHIYGPPYVFILNPEGFAAGKITIRVSALDMFGNVASSKGITLTINPK